MSAAARTGFLIAAVAVGILVAFQPLVGVVAAVGFLAAVGGWKRPVVLGVGFLGWGVVRFGLMDALGGFSWVVNYGELAVLFVLVAIAFARGNPDHWLIGLKAPKILLALFVVAAIASLLVNGRGPLELLAGLRGHLLVPIAAVSTAVLVATEEDRRLALRTAVALSLLQVPFALYQFFSAGQGFRGPDVVVGTLGTGGSNNLGLWMLGMMTAAGVEYLRRHKTPLLVAITLWAFPFVTASSRLAILLAPLALAVVISTPLETVRRGSSYRRLLVATVAVLVVMSLVGTYYEFRPRSAGTDLAPRTILLEQSSARERGVSRMGYIAYGWGFVLQRAPVPALGLGPASAASGAAANIGGPLFGEFWYGLQIFGRSNTLDPGRPGVVPLPTQFGATLVEYGPIGVGLFLIFYASVGWAMLVRLRRNKAQNLDWRVFSFWFGLVTVGTIYTNSWEGFSVIAIGFWWWALIIPAEETEAADGD